MKMKIITLIEKRDRKVENILDTYNTWLRLELLTFPDFKFNIYLLLD